MMDRKGVTGRTLDQTKLPGRPGIATFSEEFSANDLDFPHLKGHICIGICRIANRKVLSLNLPVISQSLPSQAVSSKA